MDKFFVKRFHYGGGESIVAVYGSKEEAGAEAARRNAGYQTDNYRVEQYDPAKVSGWPAVTHEAGRVQS